MPPEPDYLVDAPTAAAYVTHLRGRPCAPGTIWSWATRGHIHRHGRGRYDIREIDAHTRRLIVQELIDWLRTQLDDHERRATGSGTLGWLTYRREDGSMAYTIPASLAEDGETWIAVGAVATDYASAVIVHREAEVLAEIDAKRRVLDEHHVEDGYCHCCSDKRGDLVERAPCLTVRYLALPYADRPGYREEWRPQ